MAAKSKQLSVGISKTKGSVRGPEGTATLKKIQIRPVEFELSCKLEMMTSARPPAAQAIT